MFVRLGIPDTLRISDMARDRANIKVSREFYEEHNERRQELGLTWEEYTLGPVLLNSARSEAMHYRSIR
jgi:hypothetical protein